ncbi:MAG: 50S ribosomal protein L9 [Clostridia bacterium]|nr:50S ribosomal protein L9 [Clostridia bacterium]
MRVILKVDVPKLGEKGTVIEVAEGYARNYLIPRGLAVEATSGRMKELKQQKQQLDNKKKHELEEARRIAKRLEGAVLKVATRAGEKGKLFGSVTNKELAQSIKDTFQIEVERRKIELKEPIKALGNYEVNIKLHPEVQIGLQVQVVPEGS